MKWSKQELVELIRQNREQVNPDLQTAALAEKRKHYGDGVFVRGLIEFTNYCKNDCFYCGIRCGNAKAERYRLSKDEILACCNTGESLGFHTFVLQGGEDPYYTDDRICAIVSEIKAAHPDCAVTLSIGERSRTAYQAYFAAGADRFLLRHETANENHYRRLHPENLSLENRKNCLYTLREIGFQVGAGFMVGSPGQTDETLAEDLIFLEDLQPHMVGLGPFIPHRDTRFRDEPAGTLNMTLVMLCLTRLTLPKVLLPATTALGTIAPDGREQGLKCGANVLMPNLSPLGVREAYSLYDNKICTGDEAAECIRCLARRVEGAGFYLDFSRGDSHVR